MRTFQVLRNGRHYAALNNLVSLTCCKTLFVPLEEGEYTCADCGAKFELVERPLEDMPS